MKKNNQQLKFHFIKLMKKKKTNESIRKNLLKITFAVENPTQKTREKKIHKIINNKYNFW